MSYIDDLRFAYKVLFDPGTATKRSMSPKAFLALYYKLSIIPFILYLIVGAITLLLFPATTLTKLPFVSTLAYPLYILSGIFTLWIAIPIGIAIDAFIYQVVGRFFLGLWK